MGLARRNLLREKPRFVLSVVGIALSLMLITVLSGLLNGVVRQTGAYLDQAPGSLVVVAGNGANFLLATTPLPPGTLEAVRSDPGVGQAVPLLATSLVVRLHDRREATFLIGYDPALGGGPARLAAGRPPAAAGDVVVDRLLARRHGIAVGDAVEVRGRTFTVTGLSDQTSPLMTSFVFVRKAALEALTRTPGATSVVLVAPAPGVAPASLRARLSALPGVNVLPKNEVIKSDADIFSGAFTPVLRLMVAISFLVGVLVVGLVIYAATLERRREYGILKAVGVGNRVLYRVIVVQALIVAIAGIVGGLGLALIVARLIVTFRPEYLVTFTASTVSLAAAAGLVMALLASLGPARLIGRLAPADVFRGSAR